MSEETQPQRIGDILLEHGVIDERQLATGLRSQQQHGGTLGEQLMMLGFITEQDMLDALSQQTGLSAINLEEFKISTELQACIKWETVKNRRILPLFFEGKHSLVIGMIDPTDAEAIMDAEYESTRLIRGSILSVSQFKRAVDFFALHEYGSEELALEPEATVEPGRDLDSMLHRMVDLGGRDFHLCAGASPAIRVDNELQRLELEAFSPADVARTIAPILTPTHRDAFNKDRELDFSYSTRDGQRFRCSIYQQRGMTSFTARHVKFLIPRPEKLGLPDAILRLVDKRTEGLFLIAGSAGHGKSSTLACLIRLINERRALNIVSLEDPMEFVHSHKLSNVNQREVGTDVESIAAGLRNIEKLNPDVIAIGELRDHESVSAAIAAAETGHLVLASINSRSAVAALGRMVDMIDREHRGRALRALASCLIGVFGQRLLKRADGCGRALAWEFVGNTSTISQHIRDCDFDTVDALLGQSLKGLENIERSLAKLVTSRTVKMEEARKACERPMLLEELVRGAL